MAKPILQALVAAGRTHRSVHRGLIALSSLLLLLPHLQPELLTALAMALRTHGRLAEALTVERQRARLGTLQARPTTLPTIVATCLRLDVREVAAGLQVALALLATPHRPAIALPVEAGVSAVTHLPMPDRVALGRSQRYVQHHVPGLLELLADLAAQRQRAAQARHLPETTVLKLNPRAWPRRGHETLSAHQFAVQLAHATAAQQQACLAPLLRRRGPAQVLTLTEQLLLCEPANETLAITLRGHLVALREVGGLLALAALLLRSEATFFAHLALFAQLPEVSPAEDPLALRWLWSRLWERHPLARDVPLAVALLRRSVDADVRMGIELALQLTPHVAWAKAMLERVAGHDVLFAAADQRVPGLAALLRQQHAQTKES